MKKKLKLILMSFSEMKYKNSREIIRILKFNMRLLRNKITDS